VAPRSRSFLFGRVRDATLDWIEGYALALVLAGIILLTVWAVMLLMVASAGESNDQAAPPPVDEETTPPSPTQQPQQGAVDYVNPTQGYGFSYPGAWSLREEERSTRIESPNGRILLLFEPGAAGDLDGASSRLLGSIAESTANRQLIGLTRRQIDGSRSVLVAGTATNEAGEPVRFLAISIRGELHNYAISIFVPRRSDPARVLPRIEEIVASFDILGSGSEISI
jgi:hypothetical protein